MSCLEIVQCLAKDPVLKGLLTSDFLCALMKKTCAGACVAELCGFDGLPGIGEKCDANGDGQINCDDLKLMIELLKACRCVNGPELTEDDIVNLACKFYGPGGCARTANGGNPLACDQIALCLEAIEDLPRDRYCEILSGQCVGGLPGPACAMSFCGVLTDPNSFDCSMLGGGPATLEKLKALLITLRCCPGGDALTDAQWAAILCKMLNCAGVNCAMIADALIDLFGEERAKEIFRKMTESCNNCKMDDFLRRAADKKRGKCDTKGTMPVDLASGEKLESATDLVVMLPGGDFSIERSYSSQISGASDRSASIFGPGWSMPTQQFVLALPTNAATIEDVTALQIHAESANEYRDFAYDSVTKVFKADRADLTVIRRVVGDVAKDESSSARAWLWQLEIPGEGTRHYVGAPVSAAGDPIGGGTTPGDVPFVEARAGLLVRETSVRGRRNEFTYADYGLPSAPALRPDTIYLAMFTGESRTQARARVVHAWSQSLGAARGRLQRLSVFRGPVASAILTDVVEYRYKQNVVDELSDDTGTAGDLIQVVTKQLTDTIGEGGKPVYHSRVTQYRYHRASLEVPVSTRNTGVTTVVGSDHQLKSVILPEQVEYYAQKRFGQTTIGGTAETVRLAAEELLLRNDADEAFFDGTSRKVTDLAAKVVGYGDPAPVSGMPRVVVQFLQSACGCTGSAQGIKETYQYVLNSTDPSTQSTVVQEFTQSGGSYAAIPFRVTHHNLKTIEGVPYLVSRAVSATFNTQTNAVAAWWVWGYALDSWGRQTHAFMPSAIASYTPATSTAPAAFSVNSTGLVERSVYGIDKWDGNVLERRIGSGNSANAADYTLVERMSYVSDPLLSYLPNKVERFRWSGATAPDDVETTAYSYGFRGGSGSTDLAWVRVAAEAETTAENGLGGSVITVQLIDKRGQSVATRSPDGAVRRWTYHDITGSLASATSNATTTGLNAADYPDLQASTGWDLANSTPLAGGQLTTTYTVDQLGRVSSVIRPGSGTPVTSRTLRQILASPERPGVLYLADVTLPHKLADGTYDGPAEITLLNAGDEAIRRSEWTVSFDPSQPKAYTLTTELARAVADHAITGVVKESRR
jgi:hypothetical protein